MNIGKSLQNGLEKTLVPVASKLGQNKMLQALSGGMILTLPLTLGASVFMIVGNFPVPAFTNWLNTIGIAEQFNAISGGTLSILALFISFTVAYRYTNLLGGKPEIGGLFSLASFLIVMPQSILINKKAVAGFSNVYLGSQGIFVAILISLLVAWLYVKLSGVKQLTLKLPDSVPPMIADSFSSLFVGLIIFFIDFVIRLIFSYTQWNNVFDFVNKIIATPLLNVGGSVPAFILVYMLASLFFFFGLHPAPIQSIMQTFTTTMMMTAIVNNQAHQAIKYLPNLVVFDFVNNDATGSTLSLLIAILFFSKTKRYRSFSKVALVPNLFGINEPVVFGLPIMFNAILVIPFVFSTFISAGVAYLAVKIGFIATLNAKVAMSVPWILPKFITSYFVYGWQGVVLRIFVMALLVFLYLPFFEILDKKELQLEKEVA
ncbi:PTS sugar transporter subunit IIC [Pediococcus siamensis]|uniref:PTS sugar transporter subunit IIC n=1 Tax=Pediococcus siamensis TaxID=381829 RepID=UPI0039A15DED